MDGVEEQHRDPNDDDMGAESGDDAGHKSWGSLNYQLHDFNGGIAGIEEFDLGINIVNYKTPSPPLLGTEDVELADLDDMLKLPEEREPQVAVEPVLQLGDIWALKRESDVVCLPVYINDEGVPCVMDSAEDIMFWGTPDEQWKLRDDGTDFDILANIKHVQTRRPHDPMIGEAWKSIDQGTSCKWIIRWSDHEQLYCVTEKNGDCPQCLEIWQEYQIPSGWISAHDGPGRGRRGSDGRGVKL
jgi:hypothetical protein